MLEDIKEAITTIAQLILVGWAAIFIGILVVAPFIGIIALLTIFVD